MTDDATLSIEDALLLLTGDRRIRPADVGLAHGSAARIRNQIALSPETRRRLHRTLAGYASDLADLGVDWAAVEVPEGATAATAAASPDPVGPIGRSRVWVEDGHLWLKSPYAARDIVRDRIGAASWRKRKVAYQLPATPPPPCRSPTPSAPTASTPTRPPPRWCSAATTRSAPRPSASPSTCPPSPGRRPTRGPTSGRPSGSPARCPA